jgi:GR25 family glycosyltransferase involved in LPS biosynthesis
MKSVIITMLGHELSEQLSSECRAQAAKIGIDVEIFEAIWGKDYEEHLKKLKIRLGRQKLSKMTLGHYGNFLSHFYLWKNCYRDQEPYLVLEHDGWLLRPIPEDMLSQFNDICKLDCYSPFMKKDGGYANIVEKDLTSPVAATPLLDVTELTGYDDAIRHKKHTGYYSTGVYAYIIKPQGAKKLIDWVYKNGFQATDNQVNSHVLDIKICVPPVARLHPVMKNRSIIGQMSTSKQSPNPHTGTGMEHAEQE